MFISKHEKEELQQKIENLTLLATQAEERANKSEKKISELLLKISSIEELNVQQSLRTIKVIQEFHEIEGLSDDIIAKIKTCDARMEGLEKFFASRYRHYDDMDKELVALSKASKEAAKNMLTMEKRFGDFVESRLSDSAQVKEQIKMLFSEQKMKYEKVLAIERVLEVTRGVLFGLKKDMAASKKEFNNLCKVVVIRGEPVFTLESDQPPPVVEDKPLALYGYKKDGTPRKRPGRPPYNTPEIKNEQPLPV